MLMSHTTDHGHVYVFATEQHSGVDSIALWTCLHGMATLLDHIHDQLERYCEQAADPPTIARHLCADLSTF